MIPSGVGGAYLSLTKANNVDVHSTVAKARWNPTEQTTGTIPGESIAADPANALRQCLYTGLLDAADEKQAYLYLFQNTDGDANAQINEQPSTIYLEFEMYMDWVRPASGSEQWMFFKFIDTDGRDCKFINYGATTTGVTNGDGTTMGITLTNVAAGWAVDGWRTIRLVYTKSSNPGTTLDGEILWYASVGSKGNDDTLTMVDQLSAPPVLHHGGALRALALYARNINTYTTISVTNATYTHATRTLVTAESMAAVIDGQSFKAASGTGVVAGQYIISTHGANSLVLAGDGLGAGANLSADVTGTVNNPCGVWYRNPYWSTTLPAGAAGNGLTDATPWFHTYARGRPHLGQQDQSTTANKVKLRVWSFYDRNQFQAETLTITGTAQWKYATDSDDWSTVRGSSSGLAVNITADAVDQYVYAETLDNLPENTAIHVRLQWAVDVGDPAEKTHNTAQSSVTTISRDTPTTIRIVSGSCSDMINVSTPHSAFDVIPSESPTFVFHLGDFEYLDNSNTMNYSTVAGYVATAGTAAARQALVKQYKERALVGNCQFDKLACSASTLLMPDDHDFIDAFGGLSTTPVDFTAGDGATLRDEIEAIHRQYIGTRTFNYEPGEATSTVHYFRQRTCKCDILTFDCRRHNNLSTSPIGSTQLSWARTIIQATTKPVLVLVSTVPWHSGISDGDENWGTNTADRNTLLDDAQANSAIRSIILISGDRHYVSIVNEFAAWPKVVIGDLCVSPYNKLARDYTEDTSTSGVVYQTQFGKTTSQVARGYLLVTIDEASLSITAEVKGLQGTTTQSTASSLWSQYASSGSGGNNWEWLMRRRLALARRRREQVSVDEV